VGIDVKLITFSEGFNFNEGGHILTFFWNKRHRMVRIWCQPLGFGSSRYRIAKWFVERVWRY
jgi:hypothetical protein